MFINLLEGFLSALKRLPGLVHIMPVVVSSPQASFPYRHCFFGIKTSDYSNGCTVTVICKQYSY